MTSPGLKTTVKLETGDSGSRLVDSATGRSLVLSDTEALLLEFWDGTADPEGLARAAGNASLSLAPYQVAVFLTRLNKAGFIEVTPPSPAPSAAVARLELTDVVPRFRDDLQLIRTGDGRGGAMQVKDPALSRSFTLFDFELSIARMLDGTRTAAGVIQAAGNIGIPVSLESLRAFVAQLRAYQFLEDANELPLPTEVSTWPKRRTWTPQVRELFQKALKLSREERPQDALPVLAEILALEPENAEARELKARVDAQGDEFAIDVDFEVLHGTEPASSPRVAAPLAQVAAATPAPDDIPMAEAEEISVEPPITSSPSTAGGSVRESLSEMDVGSLVAIARPSFAPAAVPPEKGPAVSIPIPAEEVERAISRYRIRRTLAVIGLVLVFATVGFFLRPVAWRGRVECRVLPTEVGKPTSPRAGVVSMVAVREGAEVKQGDVLARLDDTEPAKQQADLETRLEAVQARVAEMEAEPCDQKVRERLEAKLSEAKQALEALRHDQEVAQAITDEGKRGRTLKLLDTIETKRLEAVAKLETEHEEVTLDKALLEAKAEVEDLTAQIAVMQVIIDTSTITAPTSGLFMGPANAVGLKLAQGDALGRIVSRKARVEAPGPFPKLVPLPEAKLDLEVVKVQLSEETWTEGPTGRALAGTVEVRDTSLFGKRLFLELSYGQRPYYEEILGGR